MSDLWKVGSVPFVIWRRMGRTPGSEDCEEREGELALCMVWLFDHLSSTALSVWRIVASLAVKMRTFVVVVAMAGARRRCPRRAEDARICGTNAGRNER